VGGHGAKDERPHGWARWADAVAARPWPALLVAIAVLIVLALPVRDMRLGQQDVGQLPKDTTARVAYDRLDDAFGPGQNGPFLVAVSLDPPAHSDQKKLNSLEANQQQQEQAVELGEAPPPTAAQQNKAEQQEKFLKSSASDPRLVKLEKQIGNDRGVESTSEAAVSDNGRAAAFTVVATTAPSAAATEATVRRMRDHVIPAAEGNGVSADVGGTTASYIDLADRISERLPAVIAIIVALSFVLLLVAFRSVVIPITAALMNLLSVAAAYGVLVAVFEKGWGLSVIGLDHTIPIVSFVPLLMFAVLFGLSMDYQVFLVSRIGEIWRERTDNRYAVVHGLATSARVITSAALIMVTVFASFILNGDPTVKQFGVGLAVAIAVDATIVRCLLVPAAMVLLGRANWWFPAWLGRAVPRVGLETEEALPEPAMVVKR
jgi:RND superfamily putative drug exporter